MFLLAPNFERTVLAVRGGEGQSPLLGPEVLRESLLRGRWLGATVVGR